jgi:hypothetical protein
MVQNQKNVLIGPSGQMCHSLEVAQYPLHMAHIIFSHKNH